MDRAPGSSPSTARKETLGRYWDGVELGEVGILVCIFQSLLVTLPGRLSPQVPFLPWSISTPSSHWPCPVNWSFQAEVGDTLMLSAQNGARVEVVEGTLPYCH